MSEKTAKTYLGAETPGKGLSIAEEVNHQYDTQAMRENLRGRIISRTHRAQSESNRLMQLKRLADIVDKNPDFCEFIDLIQSLDLL